MLTKKKKQTKQHPLLISVGIKCQQPKDEAGRKLRKQLYLYLKGYYCMSLLKNWIQWQLHWVLTGDVVKWGEFCKDGSKFLHSGSSVTSSEVPTKKLITFKSQLLGYSGTAATAITFTWNVCYCNKITSQKLLPVYCCLLSPIPKVFTCQHRRPFIGKGDCKRKGL